MTNLDRRVAKLESARGHTMLEDWIAAMDGDLDAWDRILKAAPDDRIALWLGELRLGEAPTP